jgi:hypothetical protein
MSDVQYASTKGTAIRAPVGAELANVAKAEITIDFSSAGAFVFHASQMQQHRLENRRAVDDQIVKAYRRKKWNRDWFLVEAIHFAKCATVIVSEENSAQLILAMSARGSLTGLSLSDPKVGFKIVSTRGKLFQTIGGRNLHPLYSCLRLAKPLFGKPAIQAVRGASRNAAVAEFSQPGIDELINS